MAGIERMIDVHASPEVVHAQWTRFRDLATIVPGTVAFHSVDAATTAVRVRVEYEPTAAEDDTRSALGTRIDADLGRFKSLVEASHPRGEHPKAPFDGATFDGATSAAP